jgi:GAF domain-containing protein
MKLNGAQFGIMQVYDYDRETLIVFAQRNLRAAFLANLPLVRLGAAAPSARSFAANGPVTIEDTEHDPTFGPSVPATREAGIRAMLYVPVPRADGNPLGVLSTHYSEPHEFAREDIERLERYAGSIGPILEVHLRRANHSA